MALIEEITDSILLAKSFQTELTDELLYDQKRGCMDCKDQGEINRIENLVVSLENRVSRNTLDEETDKIYNCLLTAIANYSGSSLPVDPNANVPNITIDVTIIGNNQPNELTFYWSDFIDNGEEGRVRYENPLWVNWNPMLSIGNMPYLEVGVDYNVLPTGGFTLLLTGNVPAIYEDQIMRSVGYEPYTTPDYPSAGTYRLANSSTIDTSYFITSSIPLVAGQTVNNAFTSGQSLLGVIADGQKLNFTRYLSNGDVDLTLELTNPPSTQLNTSVMDLTKSYEFIYTDNE